MHFLLMAALLGGCTKDKDQDSETGDNGGDDTGESGTEDSESGETSADCTTALTSTDPATGATEVYFRDPVELNFDDDASSAVIRVLDPDDVEVPYEITWSKGNVQAVMYPDFGPSTAYRVQVDLCGASTEATLTTSSLGTPIAKGSSSLLGHTYVIQLSEAEFVEPATLGSIAAQYLTVPLLFEVTVADATTIEFLGALGYQDDLGSYHQYEAVTTWAFPAGDFTDTPYFAAAADAITIMYGDIPIPIENFTLEGSFTADGAEIRKGRATGNADSRYMAPLIGLPEDDYGALCELASSLGVKCETCSDGMPYCLYIVAEEINGLYQPGLDLTVYE